MKSFVCTLSSSGLLPLLLSGTAVLAQNYTYHPPNTTATQDDLSFYNLPGAPNLTTITIEYRPHPWIISGSHVYNVTFPLRQRRVAYFVLDGLAIVDGDVVWGTEAEILAAQVQPGPAKRDGAAVAEAGLDSLQERGALGAMSGLDGVAVDGGLDRRSVSIPRGDSRKWPGGVVRYYWFDQATKDAREDNFLAAVKVWTDRLPFLSFVDEGISQTTTLNGPVVLTKSDGRVSSSPRGRALSAESNKIVLGSIGTTDPKIGVYVHELGHTLGLVHEHKRPDRAAYLNLDCSRVCGAEVFKPPPNENQIDHCTPAKCTTPCEGHGCQFVTEDPNDPEFDWSGPYDVASIMQYGAYNFASPPDHLPPLTAVSAFIALRDGNGDVPTLLDAQRVCNIYWEDCRGVCGDGILSPNNGEQCDDGNNRDGDGCSASCRRVATCGNGVREPGEQCDDGNTRDDDGCSAACRYEFCGDGVVQFGTPRGEECDDGPLGSATCTSQCKLACELQECDPRPGFNLCDITTSCIPVVGATGTNAGKHYCACAHGFRVPDWEGAAGDPTLQVRLPWVGQEGRVFVKPGAACSKLCDGYPIMGDSKCDEVKLKESCYVG